MNSTIKTLVIALAVGLCASGAFAAATASDTAANYSGGWSASTTPNLGSGFGAWSVSDNNANPPYAGTYLDLASYSNPDTVLSGGYAWGLYANGANNAFMTLSRAFNTGGGSASLVDQTFSFAFGSSSSSDFPNSYQSVVMGIGSAFSLSYIGGGADNMTLSVDGGTANPITVNAAQMAAGINVALTVTGPVSSPTEGYSLVISPFAGGSALYSSTGTFDSSTYDTSSFSVTITDPANNQYLNNLSIVPEPSSMVMLGFASLASLLAIRRRK